MTAAIALGAPNVYTVPDEFRRTLGAVRMDVCAFAGVAPRGPVRIPVEPDGCNESRPFVESSRQRRRSVAVPVDSWDQYLSLFGAYEGPGRLPYAVASFFEQGGTRAYIVRVVHDYRDDPEGDDLAAVAELTLDNVSSSTGDAVLAAKSEGTWGNHLRAALGFTVTPIEILANESSMTELVVPALQELAPGTLLRLRHNDPDDSSNDFDELRFASRIWRSGASDKVSSYWHVSFSGGALPGTPDNAEIVSGDCLILDAGSGIVERFAGVGLSAEHPRALANVLYRESELVNPTESWIDAELTPLDLDAAPADPSRRLTDEDTWFAGGEDRYADIVPEDFFDQAWILGNPEPGAGVHAITRLKDVSMLVTPDLYVPEPLPEAPSVDDDEPLSNAEFGPCVDVAAPALDVQDSAPTLPGLILDPTLPEDLERITDLQRRLVDLADTLREFVVLLDVPPGLRQRQILRWRTAFGSPYAAAYHPWLNISTLDDARDRLILLNPGAVAAGIIARQERQFGVPHGPANVIARAVVSAQERVAPATHDQFHPLGINVFRQERDGVWLTAARTLSRDPSLRQLSVLRLMVMLRRVLLQQMQWVVFEPNGPSLWSDLRFTLEAFLRQLYIAGAFKGATEAQAFFVRCDGNLNNRRVVDAGKLIVEIGVAPAEPLEFIVVRITRDADGTLTVEG